MNRDKEYLKIDFEQNKKFLENVNSLTKGFFSGIILSCLFYKIKSKYILTPLISSIIGFHSNSLKMKINHDHFFEFWKKHKNDENLFFLANCSEFMSDEEFVLFYHNSYHRVIQNEKFKN